MKQFKILVNGSLNIMAGERFPKYFRDFMRRNYVHSYEKNYQVTMAVLDNYLAITCTDENAKVFALPINRKTKERKDDGKFIRLNLPVSNEWRFQ